MKVITLILLNLAFYCVSANESTKSNIVIDRTPDLMQHAYATNDPYVLQHQAVRF